MPSNQNAAPATLRSPDVFVIERSICEGTPEEDEVYSRRYHVGREYQLIQEHSVEHSEEHSVKHSVELSVEHWLEHSVEYSAEHWVEHSAEHSVEYS